MGRVACLSRSSVLKALAVALALFTVNIGSAKAQYTWTPSPTDGSTVSTAPLDINTTVTWPAGSQGVNNGSCQITPTPTGKSSITIAYDPKTRTLSFFGTATWGPALTPGTKVTIKYSATGPGGPTSLTTTITSQ